ncbi:MAG: osmoprotectant transport system permease protein [Acidimicrobiales bacterium]
MLISSAVLPSTKSDDHQENEDFGSPPDSEQPSRSVDRWERLNKTVALVLGLLAFWWFTFGDDTSDDKPWDGVETLVRGIADLPSVVSDGDAYSSWWSYVTEREGFGDIFANMVDHSQLVMLSVLCAVVIGVTTGIVVHRVPQLRAAAIGISSIMLTIPSLALFAVFLPIGFIGIGDRGPLIALTLYSLLPILRNTITGLEEVDSAVVESAKGMGLSARQRLIRIELPLAWPVILAGVRVATLLNIGIAAIAVLVGGTGLGGYVSDGLSRFPQPTSVERMWTGVVFTVVLALVFDLMFMILRKLTTPGDSR